MKELISATDSRLLIKHLVKIAKRRGWGVDHLLVSIKIQWAKHPPTKRRNPDYDATEFP
jgi:2C-methyl-D-erythritol 2,4-cyclodiphosphate synthase